MSVPITFYRELIVGGVLTNAASVTYGIVRLDTMAVVTAAGTAATLVSTGLYSATVAVPVASVTYRATFIITLTTGPVLTQSSDQTASIVTNNYTFNLITLVRNIQNAAQGAKDRAFGDAIELANEAMLDFVGQHEWRWTIRTMSLAVTEDQSYIALPADFTQLKDMKIGSGLLMAVSIDQITNLRAYEQIVIDGSRVFYYALGYTPQANNTSQPLARLEIYPTPTATVADFITGRYARMIPALVNGTDVPDMPAWAFPALRSWVDAYTQRIVGHKDFAKTQERAEAQLARAKVMDGGGQTNLGRMQGASGAESQIVIQPQLNVTGY